MCTKRYKLIHYYKAEGAKPQGLDTWELIDLEVDPNETKNFYNDPAYADVQKKLHAELKRLRKQYQVPETDLPSLDRGQNRH